jgi:hypothetical protein
MDLRAHRTKIIATIGPASSSRSVIGEMIHAGMDIARLNFSHSEFDDQRNTPCSTISFLSPTAHPGAPNAAHAMMSPAPPRPCRNAKGMRTKAAGARSCAR